MTMEFEPYAPPAVCGARRGKVSTVACELPPGHTNEPHWHEHFGRDRAGRWHSWCDQREGR